MSLQDVYAPKTTLPSFRQVNDSATTQSSTVFIDGGTVTVAEPTTTSVGTAIDRSKNLVMTKQTIADFLAKPHVIASFDFAKSDAQQAVLMDVPIPTQLFASNEVIKSKCRYFTAFRGDVVVRVQTNPSMAHSGKLLFVHTPYEPVIDYDDRLEHFTSITQLPKVELDLGTDRTAVFRIPYRLIQCYMQNITSPQYIYGRLRCMVYAPLRGGSTDTVPVTVWAWFDPNTVVLANPTADNDLPMSTRGVAKPIVKQGGGVNAVKAAEKETPSDSVPVSKALATASVVAGAAGALFPPIAAFSEPVAWAAGLASGVASSLGYSNPREEKAPSLVISRDVHDLCTVDQAVPGYVYSWTGAARVKPERPAGLTEKDELHFSHLLPISTYREIITWQASDGDGHALIDVEQVNLSLGVSDGALYRHYAPYTAIAGMFQWWRGHIRFTFKFAKSRFHSGRLLVCFDCDSGQTTLTMAETDPLIRTVIDLESGNEFTFECPFPVQSDYTTYTSTIGRLSLFVLTPLAYAGGASDTIDIVVETSMRADASFGYPRGERARFITDGAALSARRKSYSMGDIVKQSQRPTLTHGLPVESVSDIALTNNVTIPFDDPVDREQACFGDSCRSLRVYLKRGYITSKTATDLIIHANTLDSVIDANKVLYVVAQWYALMRGSIRYVVRPHTSLFLYLCEPEDVSPPVDLENTAIGQYIHDRLMVPIEVPNYAANPWRFAIPVEGDGQSGTPFDYPVLKADPLNLNYDLLAGASEDFELSYFLGVKPTLLPEAAQRRNRKAVSTF